MNKPVTKVSEQSKLKSETTVKIIQQVPTLLLTGCQGFSPGQMKPITLNTHYPSSATNHEPFNS